MCERPHAGPYESTALLWGSSMETIDLFNQEIVRTKEGQPRDRQKGEWDTILAIPTHTHRETEMYKYDCRSNIEEYVYTYRTAEVRASSMWPVQSYAPIFLRTEVFYRKAHLPPWHIRTQLHCCYLEGIYLYMYPATGCASKWSEMYSCAVAY